MNDRLAKGIVIGSVIGLALVLFIFISGIPLTQRETIPHIQVQVVRVSGTISEAGTSSIQFLPPTGVVYTASPNSKGVYSIYLPGGQSYTVGLLDKHGELQGTRFLDVPSGVTAFHADF